MQCNAMKQQERKGKEHSRESKLHTHTQREKTARNILKTENTKTTRSRRKQDDWLWHKQTNKQKIKNKTKQTNCTLWCWCRKSIGVDGWKKSTRSYTERAYISWWLLIVFVCTQQIHLIQYPPAKRIRMWYHIILLY